MLSGFISAVLATNMLHPPVLETMLPPMELDPLKKSGGHCILVVSLSGDSWMYPNQRTPMGNPYISPV